MKRVYQYAFVLLATAVAAAGCKNDEYDNRSPFDNVVYLDVAEADATQLTTFKKTLPTLERDFSVVMSYPASEDVQVTVEVEPALVADYNACNGTSWTMLDASYYELAENTVTIPAGKTISDRLSLMLKNLDGSGDVAELPIDETYLLPVTIRSASGGVSLLGSSATAYYVVKRSSAITSAASLRDNWINFPTLDKAGPQSDLFNNLTAVTYEAIIRVDDRRCVVPAPAVAVRRHGGCCCNAGLRQVPQEGRIETPECRGVVPHRRNVQLRHARGLHLRQRQAAEPRHRPRQSRLDAFQPGWPGFLRPLPAGSCQV